jgi:hypothetical protein
MPTYPLGGDANTLIAIDCQEGAGATLLTNTGSLAGTLPGLSPYGAGWVSGVTGLGPGGKAVSFPGTPNGFNVFRAANVAQPASTKWTFSVLIHAKVASGAGNYGSIFNFRYQPYPSWSFPYHTGFYYDPSSGSYEFSLSFTDGNVIHVTVGSGFISEDVDTLLMATYDQDTGIASTWAHYLDGMGAVQTTTVINSPDISKRTLSWGSGGLQLGDNATEGSEQARQGKYARARVETVVRDTAYGAALLALYRNPPPSIDSISPAGGIGGDSVAIVGSNFAVGAVASFGGIDAVTTRVDSTHLTAIAPPHAPGVVDVAVTNPAGVPGTLAGGWTYLTSPAQVVILDAGVGAARNFMLDPGTGDKLIQGGNWVMVRGLPSIAQDLRTSLQLFAGEWFLDQSIGLPWFQSILVKNPNVRFVRSIFADAIQARPGVVGLANLQLDFDRATRVLRVTFSVQTDAGLLENIVVDVPVTP